MNVTDQLSPLPILLSLAVISCHHRVVTAIKGCDQAKRFAVTAVTAVTAQMRTVTVAQLSDPLLKSRSLLICAGRRHLLGCELRYDRHFIRLNAVTAVTAVTANAKPQVEQRISCHNPVVTAR